MGRESRPLEWTDDHRLLIFILSFVLFFISGFLVGSNSAFRLLFGVLLAIMAISVTYSFIRVQYFGEHPARTFLVFSTVLMVMWFVLLLMAATFSKIITLNAGIPTQLSLSLLGFLAAFILFLMGSYAYNFLYDITFNARHGVTISLCAGFFTAVAAFAVACII